MLAAAILIPLLLGQDPEDLERVRQSEQLRVDTVDRVSPAVCAVMPMEQPAGGSGVIIDPLGFVLTNFHVVGRADVMKIGLPDGKLYRADVLGIDPGSDLAILYLGEREDGEPWPSVPLGDSDQLLVGEPVFAMGNPFMLATDFTPTVTWGIVSGTHRYQQGGGNRMMVYPDCIQIDAPINPGNSGGPLFNEAGEVVGINGRISVSDRGRVNVGVGFAISSNQIGNFLGDLMAGKHAEHGTLDMNAWFMNSPADNRRGVFVQSIFQDSVLTGFGLRLGDEITKFNDVEVRSANQLATFIGVLPERSWVSLGYRPQQLPDGGYGDEKIVHLQLSRLDTGSSRDPDRLGSEEQRRVAGQALGRSVGNGGEGVRGARVELVDPSGQRVVFERLDDKLSLSLGPRRLVLDGEGGFALRGEAVSELTPEERARLERELSTNPWLWNGNDHRSLIESSLLAGGVLVLGRPAYRFELAGEGQREVWFFADGTPAGYRIRDPLGKALIELHVRGTGDGDNEIRVIGDGELQPGWKFVTAVYDPLPAEDLFRRPGR